MIWANKHIVNVVDDIATLLNVYVLTALLIIKNVIAVWLMSRHNNISVNAKAAK
jgi:hypothetical protein